MNPIRKVCLSKKRGDGILYLEKIKERRGVKRALSFIYNFLMHLEDKFSEKIFFTLK